MHVFCVRVAYLHPHMKLHSNDWVDYIDSFVTVSTVHEEFILAKALRTMISCRTRESAEKSRDRAVLSYMTL